MGKIMEAIFCVAYIITIIILGTLITTKATKLEKHKKEFLLFGFMSLVLVFGDSFHLVPRILVVVDPNGDYTAALGIGKLITSITMTIFYVLLYYVYSIRYKYYNYLLKVTMIVLAIIRIALCLMPANDWTGEAPVIWGIYRNIPFAIIGLIMIVLYHNVIKDKPFKWMWLAILLSFGFYFPVVLWADVSPMIGMLMLPKTCMYIWMVVMGYREVKRVSKND